MADLDLDGLLEDRPWGYSTVRTPTEYTRVIVLYYSTAAVIQNNKTKTKNVAPFTKLKLTMYDLKNSPWNEHQKPT